VELDWRGFELHPDTPPGGRLLADYFGPERARAMADRLARFAAGFGVHGLAARARMPNTRQALALAEYARDQGRLHPLRAAAMEAHWVGGEDLEALPVLAACARAAGLDASRALAAIGDPAYLARVDAMGTEARRAGVTGIPTLLVGRRRVVGCQPYEAFAAAVEAEGAARRE
jgi:predicted DsbA family dithiol-disulfide isomerase